MLTNPTLDRLYALNLSGMARAFAEQREQPGTYGPLPFEDRLGLLVDREASERENRRLDRYLRAAKLRLSASIEDVDFRAARGLDRGVLLDLADFTGFRHPVSREFAAEFTRIGRAFHGFRPRVSRVMAALPRRSPAAPA